MKKTQVIHLQLATDSCKCASVCVLD